MDDDSIEVSHSCDTTQFCQLCFLAGRPTPPRSPSPTRGGMATVVEVGAPPCMHRHSEPFMAGEISRAGYSPIRPHYFCQHPTPPEPPTGVERALALGMVSDCNTCGVSPRAPFCGPPCQGYDSGIIEHGAGGIGDGLLGLTAVAQLATDRPEVKLTYRLSDLARPFVALFDVPVDLGHASKIHNTEPVPGATQMNAGYFEDDAKRMERPRWVRYAANIRASGNAIPALREPNRIRELGRDMAGVVCLSPFSTDRTREWSVQHWLTLEGLLVRAGYRTVIVHSEEDRTLPFQRSEKLLGASPERLAGVFLNAAVVVGSDTGPPHLAGILGVPTLVLGGSTPIEKIFGIYPSVRYVQGRLDCSGCCGGSPADARCKQSCGNLQSIAPKEVTAAVDRIWLKETLTKDRSLVSEDRLAVIRDCVLETNSLPGDMAELGVYLGGVSKLIGHYAPGARLHLFDTFTGIPETDSIEGGHVAGDFPSDVKDVRAYLDNSNAIFHIGRFPEIAPDDGTRFRFVHLDGDTYQTTAAALDWFAPRLVPGGIIVCDDFDWHKCPGVRKALRERYEESRILKLAPHQAVVRC